MVELKRYSPILSGDGMVERPNGKWVKAEAAEALNKMQSITESEYKTYLGCECDMAKAAGKRCYPQCEPDVIEFLATLLAERDAEVERLQSELAQARALLSEAADDIADWGCYASDYYQKRHDLNGNIAKYKNAAQARARMYKYER